MSDGDERDARETFQQPGDQPDSQETKGNDCFGPPEVPCECYCLHCHRTFMSDQIWFQKVRGARDGFDGFWMCPTPNCSGKGFTFDIFPVDPDHPANAGWFSTDEYDDGEEFDEESEWDAESDPANEPEAEYDPDEPGYKELDEIWGDEDDDIEGEEWKYGLQPGETPPADGPPPGMTQREIDEEALYNSPDQRPRELDWTDRDPGGPGQFSDDDIPF